MPDPTAQSLHDWLASIREVGRWPGTRKSYMCMDMGDGLLRQVFGPASRPGTVAPLHVRPGSAYGGPITPLRSCEAIADAITATRHDEATRTAPGDLPRYRNLAEAEDDGWVTFPRSRQYRGHYILLGYEGDRLRVRLREVSALRTNDNSIKFKWLRPPQTAQSHRVIIDLQLNKIGHRHDSNRLVRRSDFLTLIENCQRVIDRAVDGRPDIDLIE